uniref:Uncharacterized protein n=1 Tax=Anser cygnoides TaxID=8845 RepID=A0A8B9EJX9_ANSCY
MPGGGIPIGAPRPGGIPMGGPIGGLMPGGGGAPLLMGGGGPPRPGVYWVGAPAMLAVAAAAAAATVPRPQHLTCWDGPPTPLTGPANPAGAWGMGAPAGTPLPAALPTPGPPAAPARGGPSTVMDTRFSPRSNTRPRTRFSSRAARGSARRSRREVTAHLILRNSSQSQRMRFMCLSKALKVPMKTRPSCRMHRMR